MQGCDYQYLQKAAPSPQCLRGTEPLVQGCWNLLAASSQSWTREAWGPEGASSWPDLGSSNTHNETLIGDKRQTRKINKTVFEKWVSCSDELRCFCSYQDIQTLLSGPCRCVRNTAGRSERICSRGGQMDRGTDELHGSSAPWCVHWILPSTVNMTEKVWLTGKAI